MKFNSKNINITLDYLLKDLNTIINSKNVNIYDLVYSHKQLNLSLKKLNLVKATILKFLNFLEKEEFKKNYDANKDIFEIKKNMHISINDDKKLELKKELDYLKIDNIMNITIDKNELKKHINKEEIKQLIKKKLITLTHYNQFKIKK
jgi:hypothetical protein